jgi:urease accessory protein
MLCEEILGRAEDRDLAGKAIDYVDIEWHEAFKKLHRKRSHNGADIAIRLGDSVLARGLYEGDILYEDSATALVVRTPPTEVILFKAARGHGAMAAKACYEIGNRHAPLFWGDTFEDYVTPYDSPMLRLLEGIHGIEAVKATRRIDFGRRISAAVHGHHH